GIAHRVPRLRITQRQLQPGPRAQLIVQSRAVAWIEWNPHPASAQYRQIGHHMTPSVPRAKPDTFSGLDAERRLFNACDQLRMRKGHRAIVKGGTRSLLSEIVIEGADRVH